MTLKALYFSKIISFIQEQVLVYRTCSDVIGRVHCDSRSLSFEPSHDKTNKIEVHQWRLRSAWASAQSDQSLGCAPSVLHADSEDSDRTGQMPRLTWVFAGRTVTLLVFVMSRIKFCWMIEYWRMHCPNPLIKLCCFTVWSNLYYSYMPPKSPSLLTSLTRVRLS